MAKGTKICLEMDSAHKILSKRKLGKGGEAQKKLLTEIRRATDPYVPKDTGHLKNTSRIVPSKGQLIYPGPYARYQYYGKVMGPNIPIMQDGMLEGFFSKAPKKLTNKKLKYAGAPMRGSHWATRAWAARGDAIVRAVAGMIGGKAK